MSCKNCQDSFYNCPDVITSDCVSYQGPEIPCLEICPGMKLTTVQVSIAEKLCELVGATNVSTIVLPPCLVTAWGTRDKTILEFILFLLEESCNLQSQIDTLNTDLSTFEPMVTVDYKCCADSPCVTVGTVTVSEAIQNVLNCLCELKSDLGFALCPVPTGKSLSCMVQEQATTIANLQTSLALQSAQIGVLIRQINCLKSLTPGGGSCV
jgi:hypothetical protein